MAKKLSMPKRIIDIHNHLHKDDDGSRLIELMDASKVEMAVIMGTPTDAKKRNDAVVKACNRFPGRFVGGAYYDPLKGKKALQALKHYRAEGLPIVKLFPNLGYFPDDPKLRPFWDKVAELGMTVLSHCGWLGGSGDQMVHKRWAAYYSHPGRFEKVIRMYPDTIFIMAHMGGIAGVLETIMLTTRTPNTYADCSPGQGLWAIEATGAIAGSVPPHKMLWGPDGYQYAELLLRYVKALTKIGYAKHLDKIFYENARGLFVKMEVIKEKA